MTDSPLTQLDRLMDRTAVITEATSASVAASSDAWTKTAPAVPDPAVDKADKQ